MKNSVVYKNVHRYINIWQQLSNRREKIKQLVLFKLQYVITTSMQLKQHRCLLSLGNNKYKLFT